MFLFIYTLSGLLLAFYGRQSVSHCMEYGELLCRILGAAYVLLALLVCIMLFCIIYLNLLSLMFMVNILD